MKVIIDTKKLFNEDSTLIRDRIFMVAMKIFWLNSIFLLCLNFESTEWIEFKQKNINYWCWKIIEFHSTSRGHEAANNKVALIIHNYKLTKEMLIHFSSSYFWQTKRNNKKTTNVNVNLPLNMINCNVFSQPLNSLHSIHISSSHFVHSLVFVFVILFHAIILIDSVR